MPHLETSSDTPSGLGSARSTTRFAELDIVSLRRAVRTNGRVVPIGAVGTIVAVYADNQGYEVELSDPFHAVVTVTAEDISR